MVSCFLHAFVSGFGSDILIDCLVINKVFCLKKCIRVYIVEENNPEKLSIYNLNLKYMVIRAIHTFRS